MHKLTTNQTEVLLALRKFGPLTDHDLVPICLHVLDSNQSTSGIRSRRHELVELGIVREVGTEKLRSGRMAHRYEAK